MPSVAAARGQLHAHTEASTGAELPRFVKDEFDAFLECGILAHGFLQLRCGECGHDKLQAFGCTHRGFCPSCGARRMSQTTAHLVKRSPARAGAPFGLGSADRKAPALQGVRVAVEIDKPSERHSMTSIPIVRSAP